MKHTGMLQKRGRLSISHRGRRGLGLSAIIFVSMLLTFGLTYGADLTVSWESHHQPNHPDSLVATAFKLFWNDKPSAQWMKTIEDNIPPTDTLWNFTLDVAEDDTIWVAMQSVNRDVEPSSFGDLTPWLLWTPGIPTPIPPIPPQGLKITVTYELL